MVAIIDLTSGGGGGGGAGNAGRGLEGPEKVAALLLTMDKPLAGRVLKHFDDAELRKVARAVASLGSIPRSVIEDIVEDLAEHVSVGSDLVANVGQVESLLEGVLPAEKVAEIMSSVRGEPGRLLWPRLAKLQPATLVQLLGTEHPQVIAFVLSKAPPPAAAATLARMPAEKRKEIVRRMVSLRPIRERAQMALERYLADEVARLSVRNEGADAPARVAGIINQLEQPQIKDILENLTKARPKQVGRVRKMLFTFEDIATLAQPARVALIDQVQPERLMLALKGADAQLVDVILSCVSARSRRMIEQELTGGAPALPRDITAARRQIGELALDMASRGLIEIGTGDKEGESEEGGE